jgi:hypothetical protein
MSYAERAYERAQRNWDAREPRILDNDDAWRESLADACNEVGCDLTEEHEIGELIETLIAAQTALDWIASNVDLPTHLLPQYRELLRAVDMTHRSVMDRMDQAGGPHD